MVMRFFEPDSDVIIEYYYLYELCNSIVLFLMKIYCEQKTVYADAIPRFSFVTTYENLIDMEMQTFIWMNQPNLNVVNVLYCDDDIIYILYYLDDGFTRSSNKSLAFRTRRKRRLTQMTSTSLTSEQVNLLKLKRVLKAYHANKNMNTVVPQISVSCDVEELLFVLLVLY